MEPSFWLLILKIRYSIIDIELIIPKALLNNKKYIVDREDLPKWTNPVRHAIVINNMCFVSGQLSIDRSGANISQNVVNEGKLAFSNVFATLKEAGF